MTSFQAGMSPLYRVAVQSVPCSLLSQFALASMVLEHPSAVCAMGPHNYFNQESILNFAGAVLAALVDQQFGCETDVGSDSPPVADSISDMCNRAEAQQGVCHECRWCSRQVQCMHQP